LSWQEKTVTDRTDSAPSKDPRKQPQQPAGEDLEGERLEPGLNAGGTGGAGATPGQRKGHDNSNT
jgi:hypothetical protein